MRNRSGLWISVLAAIATLLGISAAFAEGVCPQLSQQIEDPATVPVEIVAQALSPSLAVALGFDLSDAKVENGQVTADMEMSVMVDADACHNAIRYPIGVVLHDAVFELSAPQAITLPASNGIANVSFDAAALANALKVLLPLPDGFSISVRLEAVPSAIDGMSFAVEIIGPGQLGVLSNGKWSLDRRQPDLGLKNLVNELLGVHIDLPASRDAALAEMANRFHARIDDYLEGKSVDLGVMTAINLRIDWARWERGDRAFGVDLSWPGADPEVAAILPISAMLRFEQSVPRLVAAPVDPEALRFYLARKIIEVAPDTSVLDDIMQRFGQVELENVPLGWLRIRNVILTADALTAELAFSIGGEDIQWVPVEAPLPLRASGFEKAIKQLAETAAEAAKEIAKQVAEQKAFDAVKGFIADNGTLTLFGVEWTIALQPAAGNTLLPNPVVILSANNGDVVIDGAILTIASGTPVFDFDSAHITGLDALAKMIASGAQLVAGDLSLAVSGLEFESGRLTGRITGDFLGTSFVAEFSIGENDVDLKLPGARQAIVASLQQALDSQEISFSGLQLDDFRLCPEGTDEGICANGALSAKVSFAVSDLFTGSIVLQVHPTVEIIDVDVDSSSGMLSTLDLLTDGVATIDVPTQFSPLVISGTIKLSNLFDVVPLPDIPFEWSAATGKVHLGVPTTIVIPTDIPIPPWLNLSQVRVPIGKSDDGTVTMGMRLTVGQHYVQYVLNVDGTLQAEPKAKVVKVAGKLSVLTLPLYQVDGSLDFDKKEVKASAKTTGALKVLLGQESTLEILGEQCLASRADDVRFLFFKANGSLVIQLPPSYCGTALPRKAADCGLTADGGLCIAARVSAGDLGSGSGRLMAGFDLDFNAAVNTSIRLLGAGVDLDLGADARELSVKARIDALVGKFKLGLTIARPENGSDASVREILERIIEALKDPHIDLSKPISVNSGSDEGEVTVEADDGGEPTMSKMTPVQRGGKPVDAPPSSETIDGNNGNPPPRGGQQAGGGGQKDPGAQTGDNPQPAAGEENKTDQKAEAEQTADSVAPARTASIFTGPIRISYDPDNRVRETDTRTDKTTVSDEPLDAAAVAALEGACTVVWFGNRQGSYIPVGPAHADAVVLSTTTARSCSVPPNCQPDQFCALGLRNGAAGAGTIPVEGKFDWSNGSGLANQPQRAKDLELGVIRALAGAQLFPTQEDVSPRIDPAADWACVVFDADKENCRLALERMPDGGFPAFVSRDGTIVQIEEWSLSSWAAAQPSEVKDAIFAGQADEAITVYGSGDKAFLVGVLGPDGVVRLQTIRQDAAVRVPIAGTVSPGFGRTTIWTNRQGEAPVLDTAADLAGGLDPQNLTLTDLGEVGDAHRVLVSNDEQVWLLSPRITEGEERKIEVCTRQRPLREIVEQDDLAMVDGATTIEKLSRALKMGTAEWRKAGFSKNPAIAFFGNSCVN